MDFLSAISSIPSVYLILLLVIFLILVVEAAYLVKKRKQNSAGNTTVVGLTNPPSTPSINTLPANANAPHPKKFPWKIVIPLTGIVLLVVIILIAATFLKQPKPQQELRGHAAGVVSCNGAGQTHTGYLFPDYYSCIHNICPAQPGGGDIYGCARGNAEPSGSSCGYHSQNIGGCNVIQIECGSQTNGATPIQCDGNHDDIGKDCSGCPLQPTSPPPPTNTPNPPPTNTPIPTPTLTPTPSQTPTPTIPGPTSTPTPTPTGILPSATPTPLAAMCVNVKFYFADLSISPVNLFANPLSTSDLPNLKPGDKINISVVGNAGSDKGRIRVNGSGWQELIERRVICPSNPKLGLKCNLTDEFFDPEPNDLYQIPAAGTTTFTVEGQVHDAAGWH